MYKGLFNKDSLPHFVFIVLTILMIIGSWNLDVLLFPLTALFLLLLVYQYFRNKSRIVIKKIDIGILAVGGAEVIVFIFSSYQNNTAIFLIKIIIILLFYCCYTFISRDKFNRLLKSYFAGYGVILSLGTFLVFLLFRTEALQTGISKLSDVKHLYTPFGQISNDWSAILLFFLAFITYPLLMNEHKHSKARWWQLPSFMFCLFGIIHTFSRGAYLSLIVFFGSLTILLGTTRLVKFKKLAAGFVILAISIIAFAISAPKSFYSTLKINNSVSQKRSIAGRFTIWKGAGNMISDYPLTGIGSNNFALYYQAYMDDAKDSTYTTRVNNSYFQLLAEKGLVSILAYSFLFVQLLIVIIKSARSKYASAEHKIFSCVALSLLMALGVKEFTFSSFFETDGLILGFFMVVALFRPESETLTALKFSRKYAVVSFIAITLLLACINYKYFVIYYAERIHRKAVSEIKLHHYKEGIQLLNKCIQLNPNQALYYIHKAVALELKTVPAIPSIVDDKIETTSDLMPQIPKKIKTQIINHYQKALQLFPMEARAHHNLAWIMLSDNKKTKALFHIKKALEYAPPNHCYWISYGLMLDYLNYTSDADHAFEHAISLSPEITASTLWKHTIGNYTGRHNNIISMAKKMIRNKKENNPIYKARYARMIMNSDSSNKAMRYLKEVNQSLPTLNRSWLNLGFLYFNNDQMPDAAYCFHKASYLDKNDYLPYLALAMYSERDYNYPQAVRYYKRTLKSQLTRLSGYDYKVMKIYKGNATLQTLMPYKLWCAINPQYFPRKLCKKIMLLYDKMGMDKKATQYKALINKKFLSTHDIPAD